MHKNEDGSVSFSAIQVVALGDALIAALELTTQMEAELNPASDKCEDKLLRELAFLEDYWGITGEAIKKLQ